MESCPEAMGSEFADADDASAAYMAYIFPQRPRPLYTVYQEYADAPRSLCPYTNFLNGVKWSPDGSCLLTASDDNWLRVFDLPQDSLDTEVCAATAADTLPADMGLSHGTFEENETYSDSIQAALKIQEGETIYGMEWYPGMTALNPVSCCFATTSRAHPIHLWDACGGGLRCTYRGYNDVDEVTPAFSVGFSPDGQKILGGYTKAIHVFDVSRPGRDYVKIFTHAKKQTGLPGMISCMDFSPNGDILAAGSYMGGIGLFDTRTWEQLFLLQGHKGGITQVRFTADGNFLLSGARQDTALLCWDIRGGQACELYRMERDSGATNQRIQFDAEPCGRHVLTGGTDGVVRVFDLQTGCLADRIRVALDTVNGVSCHPYLNLMAVATGHRRYPLSTDLPRGSAGPEADIEDSASTEWARGSGMENVMRVFRMESVMLPFPLQDKDDV